MATIRNRARKASLVLGGLAAAMLTANAAAQDVIHEVDFEDGQFHGWSITGREYIADLEGNPGNFLWLPMQDIYWVSLQTSDEGHALTGDLTRHGGGIWVSVDVRVFQLQNWWFEPMDPQGFPIVLQLVDTDGPEGIELATVYTIGSGMPAVDDEWVRYEFFIPAAQDEVPAGWGGTGDEDPNTYEPILPQDRTYRSVLESVDQIRITTAVPGYFYVPSFWEVGFDNIVAEVVEGGPTCPADWNNDGSLSSEDFFSFLNDFFAGSADYDGSGATTSEDFFSFLNDFFAGC